VTPEPTDRRQQDRRRAARRNSVGRRAAETLLPVLGDEQDGQLDSGPGLGEASTFDPGWLAAGDAADPRLLLHHARQAAKAQGTALARVFRTYAAARAAIGVGLVGVQGASNVFGGREREWVALLCVLYAVQAVTLWLLPRFGTLAEPRRRWRQWLPTLGVDVVFFSVLHAAELGSSFNYAALLVLPVLMAGVLMPRLLALGTAAAVTLVLLAAAWRAAGGGDNTPALMLQSGLAGLGLFIICLLAGELAGRLAREELAARGSLELARQQAQLNRLVIEEMVDGVLVVDRGARVRAANPAARALLVAQGLAPPAPFALGDRPAWQALRDGVEQALASSDWPEAGREITVRFEGGHTRTLRVRVRFMHGRGLGLLGENEDDSGRAAGGEDEPFIVLLLEDVRTAQARLRQEKLAAMGRVSAGIAHEIRNPLAAIAQANALLLEDALGPAQQRLARIVAANVERLTRLVDDVTEVAPGVPPMPQPVDATAVVGETLVEWARTAGVALGEACRLRSALPAVPLPVWFDAEHLRRVLVHLLDNAHRHAPEGPGTVFVSLTPREDAWAALSVLSAGAPIPPEVERHLFEPFFSTRSRGSGLGLYICRELCERYGGSIEFRPRPAAEQLRNEFRVGLRRVPAPNAGRAQSPLPFAEPPAVPPSGSAFAADPASGARAVSEANAATNTATHTTASARPLAQPGGPPQGSPAASSSAPAPEPLQDPRPGPAADPSHAFGAAPR
jgi:two-component system, NtrC family, sensor histidine kinase PilS